MSNQLVIGRKMLYSFQVRGRTAYLYQSEIAFVKGKGRKKYDSVFKNKQFCANFIQTGPSTRTLLKTESLETIAVSKYQN